MIFYLILVLHVLLSTLTFGQTVRPAIRVRLNRPVFDQVSTIVAGLVEYEVPRVRIPATRQCFTEGCVQAHSFSMTSFRQPSSVAFEPFFPNQFRIRVTDFDFIVTGHLTGTIQIIINIPISGTVVVTGRGLSVSAQLDLQKTVKDQPYLRFVDCRIDGGIIDARIADMGLLTDTINNKYHNQLSSQSRLLLEEAICSNMNRLTQLHFSTRLSRIPKSISAKELLDIVIANNLKPTTLSQPRGKRATSDDYYDDIEKTEEKTSSRPKAFNIPQPTVSLTRADLNNFFNMDRLSHVQIDTTLLDAASTSRDFSLGVAGNVFSTRSQATTPYSVPHPFRVPQNDNRRMIEVVVSQYTLNSLLYHAHRTNSLLFHIDSKTPVVGALLKTSCSVDEVCISDEVDRIGKTYPNRRLELIIRSSSPPTVVISRDVITLNMAGRCIFFLEGTRQKLGVVPFTAVVVATVRTVGDRLQVNVKIPRLDFSDGIELLGLTASDLDGLRRTTKTALENLVNAAAAQGFQLSTSGIRAPLRLSNPHISLINDAILLQADVDMYRTLYN